MWGIRARRTLVDGTVPADAAPGAVHAGQHRPGFAPPRILGALFTLVSASLLVRTMGLGMQVAITYRYGISAATDAYNALALLLTTMAHLTVAGLEVAVVPIYARVRARGLEAASVFVSGLLNALTILLLAGTAILYLFRGQLLLVAAPGTVHSPGAPAVAAGIVPYLIPVLLLITLIGVMETLLNAEGQFGWPAYAGLLVPASTALFVVAGQGLPFAARYRGMLLICVGSLVGLLGHFGAVIVRAHRAGLRYRLALAAKDPDVRAVAALSLAPMVGGLLANLGPLVDQLCASTLDPGTITALGYANRITTAFIGIILVSAGTAVLPHLARHAVAGEMAAFKSMLRLYLWVAGLGALALGGLLIGFARPVVRVLFERGQFGPGATDRVVPLLIGLAMGLPFTALSFLLARAFSALGRTHVLMITTGTFVVFNTAFDLVLMRLWGGVGIALATSVSYALNAFILLLMLRVAIGDLHLPTVPPELTRLLSGWRRRRGSTGS